MPKDWFAVLFGLHPPPQGSQGMGPALDTSHCPLEYYRTVHD